MKRNILNSILRQTYSKARNCGVIKGQGKYANAWFVVPPPLKKDFTASKNQEFDGSFLTSLARANRALGGLKSIEEMDQLDKLSAYLFSRKEAQRSSLIEGTHSTIEEALSPEESNDAKSPKKSVQEYAKALDRLIIETKNPDEISISHDSLKDMHRTIMEPEEPDPSRLGCYRSEVQVTAYISGDRIGIEHSTYNPAPYSQVDRLMSHYLDWANDREMIEKASINIGLALPLQLALGHIHFEAIHPFADGNGRMGRIIWAIQMAMNGYMPIHLSEYIAKNKKAYCGALKQGQQNLNPIPMIEVISYALEESLAFTNETKKYLLKLKEKWNALRLRKGSGAYKLVDLLFSHPIVNTNKVSEELKITKANANIAIQKLENQGILKKRNCGNRNRVFACEEIIALIARDMDMSPELFLELKEKELKKKEMIEVSSTSQTKKIINKDKLKDGQCKLCGGFYRTRSNSNPTRINQGLCSNCYRG